MNAYNGIFVLIVPNVILACFSCSAYEDDFEGDDEEIPTIPSDSALHLADPPQRKLRPQTSSPEDDIYDFNTKDLGY